MKKLFIVLGLCFISTTGFIGCSSDDNDNSPSYSTTISPNDLPSNAKILVETYFTGNTIQNAIKNSTPTIHNSIYKAILNSGFEIDFDYDGNWTEIESKNKQPIPNEFLDKEISIIHTYVTVNYPSTWIVEIDKEHYGYSVELNTGIELIFNKNQEFVGIDMGDDDGEIIMYTSLPQEAQNFVKLNFPDSEYVLVKKEIELGITTFKIYLSTGFKIEFNATGNWIEIESKTNLAIPSTIIPSPMQTYISANYFGYKIVSIEKEPYGYKVEIENNSQDLDLKFDINGNFLGVDK